MSAIFKARTSTRSTAAATTEVAGTAPAAAAASVVPTPEEFTKNKYYCVSKLPAELPSNFQSEQQEQQFINAYADSESNYSLVINDDTIYAWCYKSIDHSPFSIQFPIDKSKFQLPIMALLTRPSSGTGQDPGLIILDTITGLIKFYESVQHAPTLGLINDKSFELQLKLEKEEYITMAENVEPAGICIATSSQRCILIQLRDFKSKPHLSYLEVLNPNNSGIISRLLGVGVGENGSGRSGSRSEIVAIRSGLVKEHGTSQQILILDSSGTFHCMEYNLLSASSASYLDKGKSFKQNLYIDDAYNVSNQSVKFMDIWPLQEESYYLALCQVNGRLLLATFGADKSGVLFYGSHQLKSIDHISHLQNSAKLFLPKPGKTAFVIVDTAIIMTDINTSYIESQSTFTYYKPRWEDIVKLQASTDIIGYGYENQSPISNPAVILITKQFGVLRIERFQEKITDEEINDPILLVKSHIEQGIFYSKSTGIDFDLSQKFDNGIIEEAVALINNEVLNSTSAYLPSTLPSIADLTELKVNLFKVLISYCQRNFPGLNLVSGILTNLQKTNCALNLITYINANEKYKAEFKKLEPNYREFFAHHITDISIILTKFLKSLKKANLSTASLIVSTLYDGVYLNSIAYPQHVVFLSWIFKTSSSLIKDVESYFNSDFVKGRNDNADDAFRIVEILYYFSTAKIAEMKKQNQELQEYENWFNAHKYNWISVLLKLDLVDEALNIAEKYHDFAALARILDSEKDVINIEDLQYKEYFNKFGYPFAASVYEHYLKHDKIQDLLLNFTNFKPYLIEYFKQNPKQTTSVAWIRFILDGEFSNASESLSIASKDEEKTTIDTQLKQLSIAKMCAIASGNNNVSLLDDDLVQIRIQIKLRDIVLNKSKTEAVTQSHFVSYFINSKVQKTVAKKQVDEYFARLLENKRLAVEKSIDLLTIIEPKLLDGMGFIYALQIAKIIKNEQVKDFFISVIILRLITIGDDYEQIINETKNNDDEMVYKKRIQQSVLLKTLKNQSDIIDKLAQVIQNPQLDTAYNEKFQMMSQLNNNLLERLNNFLMKDGYKMLIDSAKEQARVDSMELYSKIS
ncbi:NUP133 [Candida oxycetoniae]|uniref:NUP133 n=1 Tax=Candida oxycetoniae TaxID=497107 RepID=A0AAI9WXS0_9ASCO|nr:NUP133 [Candida oxycetoniae]KAI3404363.2 NUP133 [Candida oxycetoniae]